MKDNFSSRSAAYAKFRPVYPQQLYNFLLPLVRIKNIAWDCGTGNGQVAQELAKHFEHVYATDLSEKQIANAIAASNIHYNVGAAEKTEFPDQSFDLITVAQAIHWFDFEKFYAEVKRVIKPEGIIAVTGYGLLAIDDAIDKVVQYFYTNVTGAYWDEEKKFGAAIIFKNIGTQLSTYTGKKEDLPLDVQIGFSKKLNKAPFRFSALLHDLNRWNIRYDSPLDNETSLLGEEASSPSKISQEVDNLFRHLNVGGELIFGKTEVFRIRLGYSHQVRKELNISNTRSLSGFSLGIGFKVSHFRIDYGMGRQHLAGGMNHLSISTNFSEFKKK